MALALMGFMVLLIVSLATMVGMQTKLSKQSLNAFKAKQAAKFSAYQALGQIQSTLGPDQRISANASMLSGTVHPSITGLDSDQTFNWWSTPSNIRREDAEEVSGTVASNKYWVGVWNSKHGLHPDKQIRGESRASYVQNIMERAVTWLVSGNGFASDDDILSGSNTATVKFRPDSAVQGKNSVRVVSKNSYANVSGRGDGSDDIFAPIVELETDTNDSATIERSTATQTRIAWWVADEGQKASLNAIASYEFKRHADSIKYRVQSLPFYSGIQGLTVGDSNGKMYDVSIDDDGTDESGMMIARNATALDQLDAIASQAVPHGMPPSKLLFHAATCDSKGLLVNVRDGGLKKDLSLGLIQKNGKDDENRKTTEQENGSIPEYFPRPYGVSGYFCKTTAFPIRFLSNNVEWRENRREYKPELDDKRYIGNRPFAGHIFGPQMFTREDQVKDFPKMSFGRSAVSVTDDWNNIMSDKRLFKDPGGALWDQLRSYYNLRSPDRPQDSDISARVQTDDRYGAKPVVKRFQVHYVPTLVNYEGGTNGKYGVRLHMIPMLVLWNPYDTKIGEDTYYVIRVGQRDFEEYMNPIGSFRFAIGYQANSGYFQCLRDLYTERMKFPLGSSQLNVDFMRKNGYRGSLRGLWKNTIGNVLSVQGYTPNGYSSSTEAQYAPLSYDDADSNNKFGYRMSKSMPFISAARSAPWMPFGYGSIAPYYVRITNTWGSISGTPTKNQYRKPSLFPIPDGNANGKWTDDLSYWQYVVQEDNMYPSADNMAQWKDGAGTGLSAYARVARIPLYLNNLHASVGHGSVLSKFQNGNDVLFFANKGIDAINQGEKNWSHLEEPSWFRTAELHFLAYDAKGIDAGATKVFAMKRPTNYNGDYTKTSSNNGTNGPNGVIEDCNRTISPYEYLDAMMLPLGDSSGGNLGGCFYLDVPHPELEHYAKFKSNNRPDVVDETNLPNPYVLFDLSKIKQAASRDITGYNTANLTIDKILIDMQDTTVFPDVDQNGTRITPYKHTISMTPIAYCMSRYQTPHVSNNGNDSNTYEELHLSIWIYKKEGMTFTKLKPYGKTESRAFLSGNLPDYVPLLAHFKGKRHFLGPRFPSFPDPSIRYYKTNAENDQSNNWHNAGYISANSAGTGLASSSQRVSLTPPTFFKDLDKYVRDDTTRKAKYETIIASGEKDRWTRELSNTERVAFNGRFFLNWMAINPRRHSANCWPMRPQNMSNECGDFLPAAMKPFILYSSDIQQNSYASKLHQYIQADSKYIPYGYIFGIPYADDDTNVETGAKPVYNRRLFVNGSLLTTYYNTDYGAQEVQDSNTELRNRRWGRAIKNVIATSIIYYDKADGTRTPFSGLTHMGYKIPGASDSTSYVGLSGSNGTDTNAYTHILREDEVVHNIANLAGAHLDFGGGKWDATSWDTGGGATLALRVDGVRPWKFAYGLLPPESLMTDMAIGNSLCPNRICPEYSYQVQWLDQSSYVNNYQNTSCADWGRVIGRREQAEEKNVNYDLSWHYNDALWDEYFFSTLPYRLKDEENNFNMGKGLATPQNPRIQYICTDHHDDTLSIQDMKYGGEETEKQFDENAGKLWVNGAFNVNSTSVDAWKAVLATYYGQSIEGYNGDNSDNRSSAPFHRWQAPLNAQRKATASTSITQEDTIFSGYRALSDSEIEELASAIVEHVKDRGPFYSMSDFVNRTVANYSAEEKFNYKNAREENLLNLDNQRERIREGNLREMMKTGGETYRVGHTQKGVLQAAIDSTSINNQYHKRFVIGSDVKSLNSAWQDDNIFKHFTNDKNVWENWRATVGPIATGAPTYLMQQDILSRLGSFLTVRSDTFKIRAYGEIRNPVSGVVESKAWCEMVVQRTPEYIDASEYGNAPADIYGREKELGYQSELEEYNTVMTEANGGLTKLNQTLGRRFKIVSFRWLNDSEI